VRAASSRSRYSHAADVCCVPKANDSRSKQARTCQTLTFARVHRLVPCRFRPSKSWTAACAVTGLLEDVARRARKVNRDPADGLSVIRSGRVLTKVLAPAVGMSVPAIGLGLLLLGFFAYSNFPTLIISIILTPLALLFISATGLTLAMAIRARDAASRTGHRPIWPSVALVASLFYWALHFFFTWLLLVGLGG